MKIRLIALLYAIAAVTSAVVVAALFEMDTWRVVTAVALVVACEERAHRWAGGK